MKPSSNNLICGSRLSSKEAPWVLMINDKIVSIGHAYEKEGSTTGNKTSYIENCETSAVGRCSGNFGIGINSSVASADEVANAVIQQSSPTPKETPKPKIANNKC